MHILWRIFSHWRIQLSTSSSRLILDAGAPLMYLPLPQYFSSRATEQRSWKLEDLYTVDQREFSTSRLPRCLTGCGFSGRCLRSAAEGGRRRSGPDGRISAFPQHNVQKTPPTPSGLRYHPTPPINKLARRKFLVGSWLGCGFRKILRFNIISMVRDRIACSTCKSR